MFLLCVYCEDIPSLTLKVLPLLESTTSHQHLLQSKHFVWIFGEAFKIQTTAGLSGWFLWDPSPHCVSYSTICNEILGNMFIKEGHLQVLAVLDTPHSLFHGLDLLCPPRICMVETI